MVYSSFFIVSGGLKAKLALAQRKQALGREQNVDLTLGQHRVLWLSYPSDTQYTSHKALWQHLRAKYSNTEQHISVNAFVNVYMTLSPKCRPHILVYWPVIVLHTDAIKLV